jgi:hypothetical protein
LEKKERPKKERRTIRMVSALSLSSLVVFVPLSWGFIHTVENYGTIPQQRAFIVDPQQKQQRSARFLSGTASIMSMSSSSSTAMSTVAETEAGTGCDIVRVDLADERDYPIYIGTEFTTKDNADFLCQHVQGTKVLVVTNTKIAGLGYLDTYTKAFQGEGQLNAAGKKIEVVESLVLPDGEEFKSIEVMQKILDRALELKLDRKATFVALGGGVIGDMVGFAAAIYQRGVNFIQVSNNEMG